MQDRHGQSVIITGGSSGIGLDLARFYAAAGAHVALIARAQDKLDAAASECRRCARSETQKIEVLSLDVADTSVVQQKIDALLAHFPVPDIVILAAGVVASRRFREQDEEEFERIIRINLMGARQMARALLPAMLAKGRGQLCFIASLGGIVAPYGYSAYSASKFAVIGMADALRQELYGTGVGVTVVCPPEVDTPMVAEEAKHILPQTRLLKDLGGTLQPAVVTRATVRAIDRDQRLVIPGVLAKLTAWQFRLIPGVSHWVIRRIILWMNRRNAA